jgi:hypothetical protein
LGQALHSLHHGGRADPDPSDSSSSSSSSSSSDDGHGRRKDSKDDGNRDRPSRSQNKGARDGKSLPSSDPSDSSDSDGSKKKKRKSHRKSKKSKKSKKSRKSKHGMSDSSYSGEERIKPLKPDTYDGREDLQAFSLFVLQSVDYIESGRVKPKHQVTVIGRFTTGLANEYFLSIVAADAAQWTLHAFFSGLFNHIFKQNFRTVIRNDIIRFLQGDLTVRQYATKLMAKYRMLPEEAERNKILKLWDGLHIGTRKLLIRKGLNPEFSEWDEIVVEAERVEEAENEYQRFIKQEKDRARTSKAYKAEEERRDYRHHERAVNQVNNYGVEMHKYNRTPRSNRDYRAKPVPQSNEDKGRQMFGMKQKHGSRPYKAPFNAPKLAKARTEQQRREYLRDGKCFTCGSTDHISKNCPHRHNAKGNSEGNGPPGTSQPTQAIRSNAVGLDLANLQVRHKAAKMDQGQTALRLNVLEFLANSENESILASESDISFSELEGTDSDPDMPGLLSVSDTESEGESELSGPDLDWDVDVSHNQKVDFAHPTRPHWPGWSGHLDGDAEHAELFSEERSGLRQRPIGDIRQLWLEDLLNSNANLFPLNELAEGIRFYAYRISDSAYVVGDHVFDCSSIDEGLCEVSQDAIDNGDMLTYMLRITYDRISVLADGKSLYEWMNDDADLDFLRYETPQVDRYVHFIQRYLDSNLGLGRVTVSKGGVTSTSESVLVLLDHWTGLEEVLHPNLYLRPQFRLFNWLCVHNAKLMRVPIVTVGNMLWEEQKIDAVYAMLDSIIHEMIAAASAIHVSAIQEGGEGRNTFQRNSANPRDITRLIPKAMVIRVKVNGHPAKALIDSGSFGDFIS